MRGSETGPERRDASDTDTDTSTAIRSERGAGGATDPTALAEGGFDADFFEQVVAEVGVGVGVYDDTGRFAFVNEAYADMLDLSVDDLRGRPIWAVNPAFDADRFGEYWRSFDTDETRRRQTVHRRADGSEFPVETCTTAIESGGDRYHVGTVTDVTERVEGWRELERQDERLEQFASVVSHDLRNPLNVAMGRLQLVAEDCDSEHIAPVERSLDRMEELIDDVLTLARDGSRLTDPERVSLREVAQSAWSATGHPDASFEVVDDLGVVHSDQSRLTELFENLIRNAIEHGGSEVTITVGLTEDGFYVEDDGEGIDETHREKVFEEGYSTEDGGTGFGLAIVEQIAQAHGWEVELATSDAGGARFEFSNVDIE